MKKLNETWYFAKETSKFAMETSESRHLAESRTVTLTVQLRKLKFGLLLLEIHVFHAHYSTLPRGKNLLSHMNQLWRNRSIWTLCAVPCVRFGEIDFFGVLKTAQRGWMHWVGNVNP